MENVLAYLEQDARAFPQKTALRMEDQTLSFQELREASRRVGAWLIAQGITNRPVAVLAERRIETPILFFGALYAGNFYVPLDPELPACKRETILAEIGSDFILDATMIPAPGTPSEIAVPEHGGPVNIVFTSGSTGKPKGVVKSHEAQIDFIETYVKTFGFDSREVIGNQTPFFFDASGKDLYLMLKTGATLDLIPHRLFMSTLDLVAYLDAHGITFISWVPSALVVVSKMNTFAYAIPKTLKRVFFVGEVMPLKHLERWRKALPNVQFVNLYGSSEIAGIACTYEVKGGEKGALPMGRPLSNCQIHLVDGEIYLVSKALADGYYHDAERTAASFAPRDFGDGLAVRSFKTGDMAHYDENRNLVFDARTDFQIKHMGQRIELGEIETAAEAIPGISRAGCVYDRVHSKIVLFCEPAPGTTLVPSEITTALKQRLSLYMVPAKIIPVAEFKLNANGKLDRLHLQTLINA